MRQSCSSLLEELTGKNLQIKGEKLTFTGVGDRDVYNITAPFLDQGEWVIGGRVEARDTESSVVKFFSQKQAVWRPRPGAPVFNLQDPFVTRIGGELIFGGVEIFPHPQNPDILEWRTVFYRGPNLKTLQKFATGPLGMKDIRLVGLENGRIGVFTRPQGAVGGRGTIGYTEIASLGRLGEKTLEHSRLLPQFAAGEWGGANEVHLLRNGLLGVLGHIACFDVRGNRHYYPMVFAFDPKTQAASPLKLIATREYFPPGPAKRPDLKDVVFSGGLRRLTGGQAELFAGISDAEAHYLAIQDPFLEYEENKTS